MKFWLICLSFALAMTVSAGTAEALWINHDGSLVFYDDFELVAPGSAVNNGSYPGGWIAGNGKVSNAASPGPAQASQYANATRPPETENRAQFATGLATSGKIHSEWMTYIPAGAGSHTFMGKFESGTSWPGDQRAVFSHFAPGGGGIGDVNYYNGSWTNAGINFKAGEWQKWEVDVDLDTQLFTVTVAGNSSSDLAFLAPGGASELNFRVGSQAGTFLVDAVPGVMPPTGNLVQWLRADLPSSFDLEGGVLLKRWDDQAVGFVAGDGAQNAERYTTMAATQPPLVGSVKALKDKPAVLFDGVDDALKADALASYFSGVDKPITISMVYLPVDVKYGHISVFGDANTAPYMRLLDTAAVARRDDTASHSAGTSGVFGDSDEGTPVLLTYVFDGTNGEIYVDGDLEASGTLGIGYQSTFSLFTIGGMRRGSGTTLEEAGAFLLPEFLVFNAALDTDARRQWENYLYQKYLVPEPCTWLLLGLGALVLLPRRRRR